MPKFVAGRIAGAVGVLLTFAACSRSSDVDRTMRRYDARGIIRSVAPDHRTIDVEHEAIPGFMPSMTMPFSVRNSKQIAGFHIGDPISFRLTVTDRDSWIDQIKKINVDEVRLPAAMAQPSPLVSDSVRLREGDVMPPFELADQDGRNINLESFRGRPFVLTFIFTRCPIPKFCPLMSKNFAVLQTAIKSGVGLVRETRLLSVSFDPEFDSTQVLKTYAEQERADPAIWTVATGTTSEIESLTRAFAVYVQKEGGSISHGLATALVEPNGRIAKIWRGNGWDPSEIIREIEK